MAENREGYERTFEDELDWKLLEQLHNVALQVGTFCFRTKQICLTVQIAAVGILIKLGGDTLRESVFVAGFIIPLCFWFLDGVAYFYQVQLRGVMEEARRRLCKRNIAQLVVNDYGAIIEKYRIDRGRAGKVLTAFFNHSMWLYFFLLFGDVVFWILFARGAI